MPRPNWFLAFPIDGAFVLDLPQPPTNLRRFHPEDVHCTLAFLGGVEQAAAERALSALDACLQRTPLAPIAISLAEVVPMGGSRKAYTALSALLRSGRDETAACLDALRDPLTEAACVRRESRPPKPHISLARPRHRAGDRDREAGLEWAAQLELSNVRARLDRIALYTWSDARQDRLFQIVAERRFG